VSSSASSDEPKFLPASKSEKRIALPPGFVLSVLMPVYNEIGTLEEILRRVEAVDLPKQIILVDDYSTDGTRDLLKQYENRPGYTVAYHPHNMGKGSALQTALRHVEGTHIVIQDADLEYSPEDYPVLLRPILEGNADVVYGSRFKGSGRVFLYSHYVGNRFLTGLTNLLYSCNLTDMETCYKCFKREVFDKVKLRSPRFDIEPEITAKIFKNKFKVYEVPINYSGRDFEEGKKITWRDGFSAIFALIKFRIMD
jgi:glycosyltransferase involved in cell wall biosynthesis